MAFKEKLSSTFYYYQWVLQTRKLRQGFPRYKVMPVEKCISEIITGRKSASRFGDGEFRLLFPEHYLEFQENSHEIRLKLKEVLAGNLSNHIVCLPEQFCSFRNFDINTKYWWKNFINHYGKRIAPFLDIQRTYGNAFISRFYIGFKDKSESRIKRTVNTLKRIWDEKDILIIEGRYSRLGIGNDLFSNAKSIERIICPEKHAFRVYQDIYEAARFYGEDKLTLAALGPTATILCHDLAKAGFWAVDIGHIDIEYMWFLRKATEKTPIPGRHLNETEQQESLDLPEEYAENYIKSILLQIPGSA